MSENTWTHSSGPTRKSWVWKHYQENSEFPGEVKCDQCDKVLKYESVKDEKITKTTSGMIRHLKTAHKIDSTGTIPDDEG